MWSENHKTKSGQHEEGSPFKIDSVWIWATSDAGIWGEDIQGWKADNWLTTFLIAFVSFAVADFRQISISTSRIGQVESGSLQVEVDYMFFCEICLVHIRTQVVFEMFSGCWGVRRVTYAFFRPSYWEYFPFSFQDAFWVGATKLWPTVVGEIPPPPQCVRHQHFLQESLCGIQWTNLTAICCGFETFV